VSIPAVPVRRSGDRLHRHGAADGGARTQEDIMHQVTMRAHALDSTRQHQARAAAERARLLNPHSGRSRRSRRGLRALLPLAARPAVTAQPGRRPQPSSSSAAAAKI
jgi:hypothetical protein